MSDYALGHSDIELRRLATQASLIDPITERFLRAAGVSDGMRVLDVGSGSGDVALLAARLVGGTGEITGSDRSAEALRVAEARVAQTGLQNVSFRLGDPSEMRFAQPFDAVIGRYVLQFVPDASAFLRRLAMHVRPGGIIAFHELDWEGARSLPQVSLYDRCCAWCAATIRMKGARTSMGAGLGQLFAEAGLPAPDLRAESVIGSGAGSFEPARLVTDLVASLREDILRLGIATEAEVGTDDLAERIQAEASRLGSTIFGRAEVGAWTRLPAT